MQISMTADLLIRRGKRARQFLRSLRWLIQSIKKRYGYMLATWPKIKEETRVIQSKMWLVEKTSLGWKTSGG